MSLNWSSLSILDLKQRQKKFSQYLFSAKAEDKDIERIQKKIINYFVTVVKLLMHRHRHLSFCNLLCIFLPDKKYRKQYNQNNREGQHLHQRILPCS